MPSHLRRINEPGHLHFWTISCHRRLAFFHPDGMKQTVIDGLCHLQKAHGICLVGYVVMPEHVHVIVYPHVRGCDDPLDISLLLKSFKQYVGFHGKRWMPEYWKTRGELWSDPLTGWARSDIKGKPLWNKRGYDFNITSREKLLEKLDYCHKNPIARGIVDCAEDRPWSSYRAHEFGETLPLAMDWDGRWPVIW